MSRRVKAQRRARTQATACAQCQAWAPGCRQLESQASGQGGPLVQGHMPRGVPAKSAPIREDRPKGGCLGQACPSAVARLGVE